MYIYVISLMSLHFADKELEAQKASILCPVTL